MRKNMILCTAAIALCLGSAGCPNRSGYWGSDGEWHQTDTPEAQSVRMRDGTRETYPAPITTGPAPGSGPPLSSSNPSQAEHPVVVTP